MKSSKTFRLLWLWLILFANCAMYAQTYYFDSYGVAEGLYQSRVYSIVQDKGKEMFASLCNFHTQQQKANIEQTFENWRGNCEQIDDILVIGRKF